MNEIEETKKDANRAQPQLKDKFKVESIGLLSSYISEKQKGESDLDTLVVFSEPISPRLQPPQTTKKT